MQVDQEVDTRGLNCPLPILKAKKALAAMQSGQLLKVVATEERVIAQLDAGGLTADIGAENVYKGTEWIGAALRRAYADAQDEIARG